MRCEWCRDPSRIPKQVEICRDCGPRFYAMEEVGVAALEWAEDPLSVTKRQTLQVACAALAAAEKAKP